MEKVDKTDSHFPVEKMGSFFVLHLSSRKKNKIENVPNPPTLSFVEPCIVIRTCPERVSHRGKLSWWAVWWATISCGSERTQLLVSTPFRGGPFTLFYYIRLAKRMFFDTPRTWILYEPMDRDKSLLLAMTSSFITSFFPYPSPLFSVTHQMALSSYL